VLLFSGCRERKAGCTLYNHDAVAHIGDIGFCEDRRTQLCRDSVCARPQWWATKGGGEEETACGAALARQVGRSAEGT